MIDAGLLKNPLALLSPIGWQELVICSFPLVALATIFTALYFAGVIGGKNKKSQIARAYSDQA